MKLLHILRSEPGELATYLIRGMSREGSREKRVALYEGDVDYDQLVDDIFESDLVVCWW